MPMTILSENNLVDNLNATSLSELVGVLYPEFEAEPENSGFDFDEEDEPGINDDSDDYDEYQVEISLALSEQEFIAKERAIEESIAFSKHLLDFRSEESQALIWTCRRYVQETYEKHFTQDIGINNVPKSKESFRLDWDQRFLDFIRMQIWEVLKEKRLLHPWEEPCSFNRTYNAIFADITVHVYRFASQVIKESPQHHLGF